VGTMVVYGGLGNDAFQMNASSNTTVTVDGGPGTNSLTGKSNHGGFTDDHAGTINPPAGYMPLYYFNMTNVDASGL